MSYQLDKGYCEVIMMDFHSCLSSIISSNMGHYLAPSGTKNWSSRMSQLTASNLLEFRFKYPFDFCHFQCTNQFQCINIESLEFFYTFSDQGRTPGSFSPYQNSYEKILPFMHKIKGNEAFHLIEVQSPVYSIINLLI